MQKLCIYLHKFQFISESICEVVKRVVVVNEQERIEVPQVTKKFRKPQFRMGLSRSEDRAGRRRSLALPVAVNLACS